MLGSVSLEDGPRGAVLMEISAPPKCWETKKEIRVALSSVFSVGAHLVPERK